MIKNLCVQLVICKQFCEYETVQKIPWSGDAWQGENQLRKEAKDRIILLLCVMLLLKIKNNFMYFR